MKLIFIKSDIVRLWTSPKSTTDEQFSNSKPFKDHDKEKAARPSHEKQSLKKALFFMKILFVFQAHKMP